jgi:hypothetical protein
MNDWIHSEPEPQKYEQDKLLWEDEAQAVVGSGAAASADTERDAARYRWLREIAPTTLCQIAWRVQAACEYDEPDACIDAAMSARSGLPEALGQMDKKP